ARALPSARCELLPRWSGALREAGEVWGTLLPVGVAPLLGLLAAVEEEVRVMCQLLDSGQAIFGGVEARLQQAQRERGEREHLPAPRDRLLLEALERHDRVHHPHLQRLL